MAQIIGGPQEYMQSSAEALGRRIRRLATDKVFTQFLLETGRIFARRKEDVQTRRAGDTTPTASFVGVAIRAGGQAKCETLVSEFEAWCAVNGVHEERRT